MKTAALIATRAEMLRTIRLWWSLGDNEPPLDEEFGLRTMGFGWTAGQEWFKMEPHNEGLPETDERGMLLKKPPTGSSPCRWLWEMLKMRRWERFVSSFGRVPERSLKDKSTIWRSKRFEIATGTRPVRLFFDSILWNSTKSTVTVFVKSVALLVSLINEEMTHSTSITYHGMVRLYAPFGLTWLNNLYLDSVVSICISTLSLGALSWWIWNE